MKTPFNFMRWSLLLATFAFLPFGAVTPAPAQEAKLGLAERRAIKTYQDNTYPELKKAVDAAAGFEVPVEVNWDAVALPGQASSYNEDDYLTNIFFKPLTAALKNITSDQMGRDALKGKLKKITITYDQTTAPISNYPNGVKFDGSTLAINFRPYANASDMKDRADAIQKALEAKL